MARAVTKAFLDAEGDVSQHSLTEVDGADHLNGWQERWNALLNTSIY